VVLIPVHNESESLPHLCERLHAVLEGLKQPWRVVFIDDGSRDTTWASIAALNGQDPRWCGLRLSRNFGKEIALAAGIDYAVALNATAAVLMDADLQHPPEVIPEFVIKWREGFGMVYGQRRDRSTDSPLRRRLAQTFYQLFDVFGEVSLPVGAGDFRLIDQRALLALGSLHERARFSKGLYAWVGFSSIAVPYDVAPRFTGETRWSLRKLLRFAFDGISSFSNVPLRVWTYLGIVISLCSIIGALVVLVHTLVRGTDVPGFPSLFVSLMFFSGVQLMSLGMIGEYVGRIFAEVKRRPLYILSDHCGAVTPPPFPNEHR
jgi:polyisoprenyl-phosphate glycosyltransferase